MHINASPTIDKFLGIVASQEATITICTTSGLSATGPAVFEEYLYSRIQSNL